MLISEWIPAAAVLGVLYALLLGLRRRREAIRYRAGRLLVLGAAYFGVLAYLLDKRWNPPEAILVAVVAALIVDLLIPKRSRHISSAARRQAIARFEHQSGRKFNPRIHEIDHIIPFSKGGSSSPDNLHVVTRHENRSKGAKAPWWDLLGR